jgi:DNA-binding beta-propeller fold protein YncE
MTAMRRGLWFGLGLALTTAACEQQPPDPASGGVRAALPPMQGEEPAVAPGGCRITGVASGPRAGSTVALASTGTRRFAYVADEDAREVRVVDLEQEKEVAHAALGGTPSQLLVPGDGRVYVTLRDKSELVVLDTVGALRAETAGWPTAGLRTVCRMTTPSEPVSLATSADGATLLLVSRWARTLTGYDLARGLAEQLRVKLPRDPYAVVATADGKQAYVSHVVGGRLSVVDLVARTAREERVARTRIHESGDDRQRVEALANQGFAVAIDGDGRPYMPVVLVEPGDARVEVQVTGYGSGTKETPALQPAIAALDPKGLQLATDTTECLLPRAAVFDTEGRTLFVACVGSDTVVAAHGGLPRPSSGRPQSRAVAAGPTGLAIDGSRFGLTVWSQFDRTITTMGADLAPEKKIVLEPRGEPEPAIALGRELFHAAGSERISVDGRACASCHPSGRDDALTWATVEGPRQTPVLMGRIAGTAPYGWNGEQPDLHGHLRRTLRRLGGTGLTAEERDALFAYVGSLQPPVLHEDVPEVAARGAELFHAAETGCASCHVEGVSDGMAHDVGTVAKGDDHKEFDTPSLRFLAQSAPFFHDGRYPTLSAMLQDHGHKMGRTAHLERDDLEALAAYLETL